MRHDGRKNQEIRPFKVKRNYTKSAAGSVWIQAGRTTVLCTASVEESVPRWIEDEQGWITAEYSMLPGSTNPRASRDRGGKISGRTTEIQRLIGRSLRAVIDLKALGPRTIVVDCDVLEADGGTRTTSITGAFIALADALRTIKTFPDPKVYPLKQSIAAISVGMVDGNAVCDLDYKEDFAADVDMNVVMTGNMQFVEIQGTGEEATFSDKELDSLLKLARGGIKQLTEIQKKSLGKAWPF